MNTPQTAAVIVAVIVALGIALLVPIGNLTNGGGSPFPSEIAVRGENGLQLSLSLNATVIGPEQSIAVTVSLSNTMPVANNLSASDSWPFPAQIQACGGQIYPFGIALFQGRYTSGNVSGATPLRVFPALACPELIRFISGYDFQANNDSASILPGGGQYVPMSATVTVSGIYVEPLQLQHLAPGIYTIGGADEWGLGVFLYFEVQ